MRIHSKLRSSLFIALALATTAQIALPVLAQGVIAPAKVDSGSYGPIVTIISPEYSDVIKGETQIAIAIAPRRYPAQSVELLVDGRSVSGVLPVQNKFAWKTSMFIDGPHTLGVRVTDTQGFIGQSETTIYINNQRKLDDKSPILRWLGVTSGATLSGVTKLRLEAADDFGVKYVFLNLNTAIAPDIKPPVASWMTNRPPYEFSVDTSKFEDGLYVLDAYAWDANDNERNALRLSVNFANRAKATANTAASDSNSAQSGAELPAVEPPTFGGLALMPPVKSPVITFSSVARSGAMTTQPAKTEIPEVNPLRATTLSSARVSRPSADSRSLPQTEIAVPEVNAPEVNAPEVNAPEVKSPETKSPVAENSPVVEKSMVTIAPRISVLPDLSPRSSQSTPRLTPIENALQSHAAPLRSTPVADNSPARQARTRGVLATSPNLQARFARVELPVSGGVGEVSLSPNLAVSGQREAPDFQSSKPAGEVRLTVRANPKAAHSDQINIPVKTANSEVNPAGESHRLATAPRATQPRFSALPDFAPDPSRSSRSGSNGIGLLSKTEKSTQPNTRIAASRVVQPTRTVSFSSLPTLPRVAVTPEIKWRDKAKSDAAITIAPSPDAQPYYVATQNDTLAAIAARYKMPISAVATANHWPQNASVVKGTKVLLPQALMVSYKGQNVTGDVAPLLIGNTSVAPFRFLFEKQGGKMTWDAAGQRVTARNGEYEVTLEVGSDKAIVNKEEVLMDMAAFLLSGRTMVPVRFFEKALHATVEWEPSTGRIFVAMTPNS